MQGLFCVRISVLTVIISSTVLCLHAQPQDAEKREPAGELKGMPPRATPGDYQAQGKADKVTVAAEFMGHSVPTPDGTYNSDDYVVVEAALFGEPGQRLTISDSEFSLRINGKKTPLSPQSCELVFHSLSDPEWQPPAPKEKSKTSFGGNSQGGADSPPPTPPHMPIALRHTMEQHVQSSALLEGDRALPQAGLIFFEYRGKDKNIHSVELTYDGAGGKVTLPLHP